MRKLFSLMLVVLGAAALVSCSKDDNDDVLRDGEGVITFVTKAKSLPLQGGIIKYLSVETFNEGESITIDWGDGNEEEYVSVKEVEGDEVWYEINEQHTYTDGKSSHTVTVRGKIKGCDISYCEATSIDATKCPALEYLECYDNQLTSLDVSKNTALEELSCEDNQLTSLDVSRCPALERLYCKKNQLTSLNVSGCTALERLLCYDNQFSASAMNKIYNDLPVVNNGDLRCDKLGDYSIAENKGWYVYER